MVFSPRGCIRDRREGQLQSKAELFAMVEAFEAGEMLDYQMAAWLMAAYLKPLNGRETACLTEAMLNSGKRLELNKGHKKAVDKHSTGGVGDKVSLILAPLMAEAGLLVPMIAGRGLGHTGGTVDKLESIPGFQTKLSLYQFSRVVAQLGTAVIGQTGEIAPADKRIYALRDVTSTVESIPLIVASILSKKLAANLDALVLDVKFGEGAFMKTPETARALALELVRVARMMGVPTSAILTNMNRPLGLTIGNALEVKESIAVLQGKGPDDTRELTLQLGAEMANQAGLFSDSTHSYHYLAQLLDSGAAYEKFLAMLQLQGAPADALKRLPESKKRISITADQAGRIIAISPMALAHVALDLGAGRRRASDPIDHAVGIELKVEVGDVVAEGQEIASLHVSHQPAPEVLELTNQAFSYRPESDAFEREELILEKIDRVSLPSQAVAMPEA